MIPESMSEVASEAYTDDFDESGSRPAKSKHSKLSKQKLPEDPPIRNI